MTQYLPYIFGTVSFFGGLYMFLLAFKIYVPKQTEEGKAKMEDWHKKFGTLMKIGSIFLMVNGAYDLFAGDTERYKIGTTQKTEWSADDKPTLIKNCIKDAMAKKTKNSSSKHIEKYCKCTIGNIISNIKYSEYLELLEMPNDEQVEILTPHIQNCIIDLNKEIEEEKLKATG